MYTCGVEISTLKNYPFRGFMIKPWSGTGSLPDQSEVFSSLAFVCGTLTNILLDFSLAHNLIFCDAGQTIYIVPRIHSAYLKKKTCFSQGWLMVGGVIVCEDHSEFDGLSEELWEKWGQEKIAIEKDIFNNLCAKIKEMFESKFQK
eukprot:TRINITY_DN49692_c0_g1_i1.p1 TRINITY_DN49692_c0_g1~~TRINITY_DN49692_c0_g1_i1.p1  ORF type:complete len:146 (+),score=23.10 TRINITY_DN49692_c0_g1_i1:1-438(+)